MSRPGVLVRLGVPPALIVLMITAFIDMVGVLMIVPLMPFYATRFGGDATAIGWLVASFSIANLLSAPLWGRFSDRYGRRPALLVGLSASLVSYVIFAFADSLWLLFLMRVVQGAGGGTVGVIQAYVADATEPQHRTRSLGWLSAATNLGVMLGPVLGSLALAASGTSAWAYAAPGLLAAALCAVNMVFAAIYLRESHGAEARSHAHAQPRRRTWEPAWRVLTHPGDAASRLILIYAIGMGAFMGMNAMLALFLDERHGVTEETIWRYFTFTGAISVVTRAGVLGWAVDRLGEARLSRLGMVLLAAGLALLPLMRTDLELFAALALVPLGTAFTFPCVTALLSRVIPNHERGLYMGVQQTFGGIMRVAGPIWAGLSYEWGYGWPFATGAVLVLGSLVLSVGLTRAEAPAPGAA